MECSHSEGYLGGGRAPGTACYHPSSGSAVCESVCMKYNSHLPSSSCPDEQHALL